MYQIFEKLDEMKVNHCFQSSGKNQYYNLAVTDPKGKSRYFSDYNIDKVEQFLKVIWGHLIVPVIPQGMPTP